LQPSEGEKRKRRVGVTRWKLKGSLHPQSHSMGSFLGRESRPWGVVWLGTFWYKVFHGTVSFCGANYIVWIRGDGLRIKTWGMEQEIAGITPLLRRFDIITRENSSHEMREI
jgi:hypothetical protein